MREEADEFLVSRGAAGLPHPGGTLLEHSRRVADLLHRWGAPRDWQLAALCHACYGTAGYGHDLIDPTDRETLRSLIGVDAERIVYLYGSCNRGRVYPVLTEPGPVPFVDRFTGDVLEPREEDLRAFLEITAANEIDVLMSDPKMMRAHRAELLALFRRVRARLSAPARAAVEATLAADDNTIVVTGLDHFVLTVADIDRTIAFYERVLGMHPVVFGDGRRALEFGPSKINLHQTGRELTPHAARPPQEVPTSAWSPPPTPRLSSSGWRPSGYP